MELENKAKLAAKISKMLKSFGAIAEDGKNTFSNYGYISSNKMVGILREKLEENGISIIPEVVNYDEKYSQDAKGKSWIRTIVEMNFEIIDTETGFSINKKFFGADQDTGGKSSGQAVTECCKRFYFKLFQVSSTEEKDPDDKTTGTPENEPTQPEPIAGPEILTQNFVNDVWNGKLYGKNIYVNNVKYRVPDDKIESLKSHQKYKPNDKK